MAALSASTRPLIALIPAPMEASTVVVATTSTRAPIAADTVVVVVVAMDSVSFPYYLTISTDIYRWSTQIRRRSQIWRRWW